MTSTYAIDVLLQTSTELNRKKGYGLIGATAPIYVVPSNIDFTVRSSAAPGHHHVSMSDCVVV
jgi:hypothetical protein